MIEKINKWWKKSWKKLATYIGIAIVVPFLSLISFIIDGTYFNIDVLNDVHYIYLVQISWLMWIMLYFLIDLYYRKEK